MRVFYAAHDHSWENSNLLAGLRQAGAEVVAYDPGHSFDEALSPVWASGDRELASERLVAAVERAHADRPIDLFFSYLFNQLVHPLAIRRIRDLGIVTVNYWCNNLLQFHLVDEIAAAFDYCAVAERSALTLYRAIGATPVQMQLAANPERYRPHDVPREFDVTFVGQRYGDRAEFVVYLLRHGVRVRVWGPGWTRDWTYGERPARVPLTYALRHPRSTALRVVRRARDAIVQIRDIPPWDALRLRAVSGPSLPTDEMIGMFSRSRISLGFSAVGDVRYGDREKVRQVRLRDFEGPMCGACYLVEHSEELESYYEIGREIDCYGSREELLEKVRFYLGHVEIAEQMRVAARARAVRDHTWAKRFWDLFATIGLRV